HYGRSTSARRQRRRGKAGRSTTDHGEVVGGCKVGCVHVAALQSTLSSRAQRGTFTDQQSSLSTLGMTTLRLLSVCVIGRPRACRAGSRSSCPRAPAPG